MTHQFDWRDDEDPDLKLDPGFLEKGQRKGNRRKRVLLAIVLLLFISLAVILFRELQQYLDRTNKKLEEELLAHNDLVLNAAENADRDILASLLSERDPVWTEGQLDLVESGLMFDRRTFGLNLVDDSSKIHELTISPDLVSATILVRFQYELKSVDSQKEKIGLLHELNYHRSNGRWLLSAPIGNYWQGSILDEGHYISVRYPERDHYYGETLAVDLEALTAEFCNRFLTDYCSNNLPVPIELGANPETVTQTEIQESISQTNIKLDLPTPTLFGIPEDELGYKALYRAFGRHLIANIVRSESGWVCCENALLFQSLLDYYFVQLALESSVSPYQYDQLDFDESLLSLGARLWSVDPLSENSEIPDGKLLADILVEYLLTNGTSPFDSRLQQSLTGADNFQDWLLSSFGPTVTENLVDGWSNYLNNRFESGEV